LRFAQKQARVGRFAVVAVSIPWDPVFQWEISETWLTRVVQSG